MKKLILIDGNSILFRAYYATAYPGATLMQTKMGVYTNALFAFVNMFEKIVEDKEAYCLVAFDTAEPTKRHLSYEGYKAGREKMPEELAQQIALVNEYIELSGIKHYSKGGYEADDIIGTMARIGANMNYQVDIYSSDKDLLQLVNEKVTVHLLKKGMKEVHHFTPSLLMETYGLKESQMIDLKALMGDPSDNIPGIPGVGEKTAIKLLQSYGTLENILKNKEEIKGKLGERIIEHESLALMSKELVTIDVHARLDINIDMLKPKGEDTIQLTSFFQNYELHQFVKKMEKEEDKTKEFSYLKISSERALEKILEDKMAIYFEFSEVNYHKATLWGIGLSNGKNHYYIDPKTALSSMQFTLFLADPKINKYVYDYKAVKVFLKWHGMDIHGVDFDLLLAAYLINAHLGKEEFKYIAAHFKYDHVAYDELIYGKGVKKGLPEEHELYEKHIVSKAIAIMELRESLEEKLKEQLQYSLFKDIEIPLSEVLAEMEYTGIRVETDTLNELGHEFSERLEVLEQQIHQKAQMTFNVKSPKQLGEVLFEHLGLKSGKKTKTGYSTDIEVLQSLRNAHPVIEDIIEHRQLNKLYTTYIEGIRQSIFEDQKIHTIYMQALTTTGRLSSIEPNLQNIPTRTEEGKKIRKIFTASKKENALLGADYSQIELRVLADMANVENLINAFNQGKDIHDQTARTVFHVDEVTPEQRRQAKAVNFGIIYGIGAWSLSEDIHVTPKEAQEFIDRYLEVYPEIKTYMTDIVSFAERNNYVETIMKRRRYIPELKSPVYAQREFGKRTALNAPIQGSAADIIKKAMIDLHHYLKVNKMHSKILLQVHDELILDVVPYEIETLKVIVPKIMREAYLMKVVLETSCDTGYTWFDLD